ncbi:MAG: glycoside hydrolase [Candidatus Omnitrophica bacterium]|nr:glycoside hydrolase [Candidatus Omnitrophota bacterium]
MDKKLSVAFLWHMHQPLYKDLPTGKYFLPWVRLHATYSYYDMISIVGEFPEMRCTFNLTPSLLEQLDDIARNEKVDDVFLTLSRKEAEYLSHDDKVFILKNFFSCNATTQIYPIFRYRELYEIRGDNPADEIMRIKVQLFRESDFRDLQVFFNLSWCGFTLKEKDPIIKELLKKGRNYSEEDKKALLKRQREITASIIPLYKKAQDEGKIEISTTPYYHPILPLLSGREKNEGFDFKEDAEWHVKKAVAAYKGFFGRKPLGMWPAEGSVGQSIVPVLVANGIKWIATDEAVLKSTFGGKHFNRDEMVFSPYFVPYKLSGVFIAFRDTWLSNEIGFKYSNKPGNEAAAELFKHFTNIKEAVKNKQGDHVVSVILDGENPWPYYHDGGKKFLSSLFELLTTSKDIRPVTFYKCFRQIKPKRISNLSRGSWINGDFRKWIGSFQKNIAWEYLQKVRGDLAASKSTNKDAWQEIYIAESSDWFWWYDDFGTELNYVFDEIFRMHLRNVYKILDKKVPSYVDEPIYKRKIHSYDGLPGLMSPPDIDGKFSYDLEWQTAKALRTSELSMAMAQSGALIEEIFYGIDRENMYFMLKFSKYFHDNKNDYKDIFAALNAASPIRISVKLPLDKKSKGEIIASDINGKDAKRVFFMTFAYDEILEVKLPFSYFGSDEKDEINFKINIAKKEEILESWPVVGFFRVTVPEGYRG